MFVFFCSQTGYVLSRESVFQLRHRSHVRIPAAEKTRNDHELAVSPDCAVERNPRFARDRRELFNTIFAEERFARDRRQFRSKIIRDVRFARDRRQLFFQNLENGRNARDSSTFQSPRQEKRGPPQCIKKPQKST